MPEIIVALIHLIGTVFASILMFIGFGLGLFVWVFPALWHHPIAAGIALLIIAGLVKAHS